MMEYMQQEWRSNRYMQQCIFSVAGIHAGTEGKFSSQFRNIMEHAHSSEKFRSARGRHEREFEFDYLFHCFFDTNGKAFPNDDNCMLGIMCSLAALHKAVVLGWRKVQLSDGIFMEYMFFPHRGYFTNNVPTMNMHVCKHYKVGLYYRGLECQFIMNKTDTMQQHSSLFHNFGKKNKGTPVKMR